MNKITTCLLQRFTSFSYIFDRAEEEENFTFYTCRVTIKAEHSNSFHNVSSRTFFYTLHRVHYFVQLPVRESLLSDLSSMNLVACLYVSVDLSLFLTN